MKIITTVGTSLVTNLLYKDCDVKDLFEILKQQDYSKRKEFQDQYDRLLSLLKKQKDISSILSSKFKDIVDSKTEIKGDHKVYDDGNNPNRIFYFKENGDFYIYKTFQNHDIYEKYINQNSLNKKDFIKNSKLFKI